MKAHERVELDGASNQMILDRFAAAIRGDYKQKWDNFTHDEKIQFLEKFNDAVIKHANQAFQTGVEYGLKKGKQCN